LQVIPAYARFAGPKASPAGNDGLPSAIECGNQGANGVRSKYAWVYILVKKVAHFASQGGLHCPRFWCLASADRYAFGQSAARGFAFAPRARRCNKRELALALVRNRRALARRRLSRGARHLAFNPKAPPHKTAAFWDIVDANRAPEDGELADLLTPPR
jgi:hypothetical protein